MPGHTRGAPIGPEMVPAPGGTDALSLERVFGALANDSRRTILTILDARGACMTSGEIAGHFTSSWQTISRHLRVLEEAGLISYERRGRDRAYTIERGHLRGVAGRWLDRFPGGDVGRPGGVAEFSE